MSERRIDALDGLRFLAALAIVGIHVTGTRIGYDRPAYVLFANGTFAWAVPFFLMSAGYLHEVSSRKTKASWLSGRARRLLVPYAAWTVILVGLQVAHRPSFAASLDWAEVVFAGGGFASLWFLPVLFYCAAVTFSIRSRGALRAALAASVVVSIACVVVRPAIPIAWNLLLMLPVYLLGREAAYSGWRPSARTAVVLLVACMATIGLVQARLGLGDWRLVFSEDTLLGTLVAFALLRAVLSGEDPLRASRLAFGGELLLGVYLVHSLLVMLVDNAIPMRLLPALPWTLVAYVLVAGGAIAGTIVLRRTPFVRAIV